MSENIPNSGAAAQEKLPPRVYDLLKKVRLKQKETLEQEKPEQEKPPVRKYYDMNRQQFNEFVREQKKKVEV